MKQFPSNPAATPIELAVAALLALLAVLAVAQGLGSLGTDIAAAQNAAPLR